MKLLIGFLFASTIATASFFIPPHGVTFSHRQAGEGFMWGGSSCPAGSVAMDGASLVRSGTYANLFAILSTTYGAADGSHFNVPNAQGVVIRGSGSQTISAIGYSGTRGTSQADQLRAHGHRVYGGPSGSIGSGASIGNASSVVIAAYAGTSSPAYATNLGNGVAIIESSGAGSENIMANIVMLYCITY